MALNRTVHLLVLEGGADIEPHLKMKIFTNFTVLTDLVIGHDIYMICRAPMKSLDFWDKHHFLFPLYQIGVTDKDLNIKIEESKDLTLTASVKSKLENIIYEILLEINQYE